jgi:hypothetical protein
VGRMTGSQARAVRVFFYSDRREYVVGVGSKLARDGFVFRELRVVGLISAKRSD